VCRSGREYRASPCFSACLAQGLCIRLVRIVRGRSYYNFGPQIGSISYARRRGVPCSVSSEASSIGVGCADCNSTTAASRRSDVGVRSSAGPFGPTFPMALISDRHRVRKTSPVSSLRTAAATQAVICISMTRLSYIRGDSGPAASLVNLSPVPHRSADVSFRHLVLESFRAVRAYSPFSEQVAALAWARVAGERLS
jgi:hypothetical protein